MTLPEKQLSTKGMSHNPFLSPYNTPHDATPFNQIKLEHYMTAFTEGMNRQNNEIAAIINNQQTPDFHNIFEAFEHSGRLLDNVSQVFFNLHSAETNDQMQIIAEKLSPILTDHVNNITLNDKLFERIKAVYNQRDTLKLTPEQQTLLQNTYDHFADNGANLNETDKQQYRELTKQLNAATLQFEHNVLKEINDYSLLITDTSQLQRLSSDFLEIAAEKAKQKGQAGWILDLSAPSYVPAMKFLDNPELRKTLYLAFASKGIHNDANDNQEIVRNIANLRLKIASLLGFNTYAEYVLRHRMAQSSENVYKLLQKLLSAYKPVAKQEYEEVQDFLRQHKGEFTIQPWDWPYYAEKLKTEKYAFNEDALRPYFELDKVINGVFGLAQKLYGIRFEQIQNIPVYHPEVKVFEVYDQNNDYLALLYADFFPRAGKRAGAWMTEFKGQWMDGDFNSRPHISLVMNFTRPTSTKPALLTYDEVRTFLHEFGHALHGMLTNTQYASLSGTNVYRDFVELPSQFMENYGTEKEFLDQFASHFQTGETIPTELIQRLKTAENYMVGYLCVRQLNFGFLDMAWHTLKKPFEGNVIEFEKQATKNTSILPVVDNTCISTAFSHIFAGGYAAGYYSYKWAEVLEADAFSVFKEHGIFDQATANAFRTHILSKGGTEAPMELYKRFRGQEPSIDALLKANGIK
ncbi:M3 family metallopeptidase [Microbacter margulisiae]|uniref:Peptidyl-dipeptidase Dcp n=1 Tax=Microbacter margulisiae TaxID=1350067 RepID=A0A7W5H293_9PORP|nr:M3 family metallopeptidase [Microbacter margulisiae]MBB3187161.1 peptidyl-dipeptidase Dcp [Microbacter margulisiae]